MTDLERGFLSLIIVLVGLNVLSLVWWGGALRALKTTLKYWQESEEDWCEIFSDFILTEMSDEEMVSEESYEAETA